MVTLRTLKYALATLCLLLFCLSSPSHAQSKKQLENERTQVEKEIKKLNSQLSQVKKNSKAGQKQIALLDRKIGERTKLINNLDGQINLLSLQVTATEDSMALLRGRIDSLKVEYGRVVRALYRERGNLDKLVLVLDTKSYNYAYLRTRYFRDYSRYRRRQARLIEQQEQQLDEMGMQLRQQQRQQSDLRAEQQRQKEALMGEQRQQQKSLKQNRQQQKTLQQQIAQKEKHKRQLQQQIQRIINEELAKARSKEAANNSSTAKTKSNANIDVALSNDFASNKGRLPWPVSYNKVLRDFGRYTHASGGQNVSNGIDLACAAGTTVKSVFAGTVSRLFTCPNGTKGIIIRHGEYMSVYAGMGSVTVAEGTKVSTGQNLGTVFTASDGSAEFSFQLWKGTTPQNPRTWLR